MLLNMTFDEVIPGMPDPAQREALRRAVGLTRIEMAKLVGVSRSAIWRWERGSRTPRGVARARYLDVLREIQRRLVGA